MRLAVALLVLFLAAAVQFWLASGGIFANLIFATLIVLAFFFDFWEMVLFVLFGVLVVNWQPGISVELVAFALIPLLVFAFRGIVRSERWISVPVAVVLGLFLFYLIAAPHFLWTNPSAFFEDLLGSFMAGELAFFVLKRIK